MTNEKNTSQEKHSQKRKLSKPRRRGTGSVFRRPERKGGKEWIAQILLENGKTKQTYHNTQAEAEGALNEMLYEQRRGMLAAGTHATAYTNALCTKSKRAVFNKHHSGYACGTSSGVG